MVIVLADILRTQIDSAIIGKMIGFEDVAIYGIAGSLIIQLVGFTVAGVGVLTPRFANLEGGGQFEELKKLFVKSLHFSALVGIGVCVLAFLWSGSFIHLWVGQNFGRAVPIVWILALAGISDLAQSPAVGLMYSLNKHRYYAGTCLLEGVLKFALTLILVQKHGIIGAALASAIPMVVLRVFIQPIYVSRMVGLRLREYAQPFFLPLVSGILVFIGCFLLGAFPGPIAQNWFLLGVFVALTGVVYTAISLSLPRAFGVPGLPLSVLRGVVKVHAEKAM